MKNRSLKTLLIYFVLLSSLLMFNGCDQVNREKSNKQMDSDYYVAAYIWPSCHHDERFGDMLWPDGEGEWEVIKKGNPRFEGHYQPR
ncbi:MAG TPA: hypothetical protein VKZ95_05960, partial [Sphingobacteriaceae bacterium]|nr:hypothetical protein [Sphingobacteriaceae bacterium]